jgi:hypothetical protein
MHASSSFWKGINAEEEDRNGPTRGLGFFLIRTMLSHMQLTADGEHVVSILSSPGFPTGRGRIQATDLLARSWNEILVS